MLFPKVTKDREGRADLSSLPLLPGLVLNVCAERS